MKNTQTSILKRSACLLLAFLTVFAVAPFMAVEANAADASTSVSLFYDFEGGNVDESIAATYFDNADQGFTGGTVKNMAYCYDPIVENPDETTNMVVSNSAKCGYFTVVDGNKLLIGKEITIEAKFYIEDAFPVKDGDSGSPLSLLAFNNGSSNYPLVRVKSDGTLELRQSASSSSYTATSAKMTLNNWHTVKVVVDGVSHIAHLYLDGAYVSSLKMIALSKISHIRVLQGNGIWKIYADDLSVTTREVGYDMYASFDNLTAGTTITNALLKEAVNNKFNATVQVNNSGSFKAVADPDDASNIVAYGNKAYIVKLNENDCRVYGKDFVVSGDFRFDAFPTSTTGSGGTVSFFAWVTNNSTYYFLCNVEHDGSFVVRNGSEKIPTGHVLEKDKWYNVAVHYQSSTGKADIYLDGEYVGTGKNNAVSKAPTASYIRVLNNYQVNFSAYVDDLQFHYLNYTADTRAANEGSVIWDVDFEQFADGTKLTKEQIYDLSAIADANATASWVSKGQIVTYNGSKAMKISGITSEQQLDLYVGSGLYEPLKDGTVRLAFDLAFESFNTTGGKIQLIGWRKNGLNGKSTSTARIVDVSSAGLISFCGTSTDVRLELNKTYSFELIINNQVLSGVQYTDVTFKIDGKTIASSYPLWKDSQINSAIKGGSEGYGYVLDDAGNKCYLPFVGFAKTLVYDDNGNAVTDGAGNNIYADKFTKITTAAPDAFRMFQGGSSSDKGSILYVDNLIVEQLEDGSILDFGFDGWPTQGVTVTGDNGMKNVTGGRINGSNASFVTDDNGNTYLSLPKSSDQKSVCFGDKNMDFFAKDMLLNTDICILEKADSTFSPTTLLSLVVQTSGTDPYAYNASTTKFTHLLYVDHNGNLFLESDKSNPIGKLKEEGWTNIQVFLDGNGETWGAITVYIDGKLCGAQSLTVNSSIKTYYIRCRAQHASYGFDNISLKPHNEKVTINPISINFNDDSLTEALARLGAGWQMGSVGSDRAKILGDEGSKYLHVDHTGLTENKNAYIDFSNAKFINDDAYLVETAFRYKSTTAYNLAVATVYRPNDGESASILQVRGDSNKMFVTLRGVQYDVVNSENGIVYAENVDSNSFTKVAILVNDVYNTYTLYINDTLAYYSYNGKALPCVDMPLHFIADTSVSGDNLVRLLEISNRKYAESMLDFAYVNVCALPNGTSTEVLGSQTRIVDDTATFDVRFVSALDTLYGNAVGFEVVADYTDASGSYSKSYDAFSSLVFEKITADDKDVTAESLNTNYLAAVKIIGVPTDVKVTFRVSPYVLRGNVKVYGQDYSATFENGAMTK